MKIKRMEYPISTTKKYNVIHEDKEYTCYICSLTHNLVVTGNGMTEDFEDITDTNLGARIIINCYRYNN